MTECEIDPATHPKCDDLFRDIEAQFEASQIPSDKWYLTTLSALTTTPDPHLADQLYVHLTSTPAHSTAKARLIIIQRMRETLFKNIALLGLPKPAEALISISRVEPKEDTIDQSFTRKGWQRDDDNRMRGIEWLNKIYAHNTEDLFNLFQRHRDWQFWIGEIAYGLHLSDRQVLDDIDTELVVLPAVMGQNLPRETYWHIRGLRRLGVSKEDVQMVCDCVHKVSLFCGVKLDRVPSVERVDADLKPT
ncbi:hypothetical protein N7456_008762 [Penicillium angulare]|uniref:Carboxymuconolactone decarboxylase-like domain-containing protein n=1 Tax=Penicillium angulare TaxID=116970 RepID=A0A9W9F3G3_9EURO|nr:hypothetical protein N7456_008762 [Penicillium angulare]